ncbi:MAG: hypothetical protein GWN73_04780, partial [Actinobacteria bacterium]|nr:hypothetical protein [Actinomycetota bacterium]NIS29421.1 hypothetical protein [Actinomycetota bacterium]NIU64778.1 hypothetical protein [Actinomycetota bacterium]NIW26579.1 hypothetical protein [Actinomycetota bacterium]
MYVADAAGKVVSTSTPAGGAPARRLPQGILDHLGPMRVPGEVVFTDAVSDAGGDPAIYMALPVDGGRLALGALDTGYLRELQGSIAFGEAGHAAIV